MLSQALRKTAVIKEHVLYVDGSICSGSSVTLTSKRDWIDSSTSWSASEEINVIERPLVPKRPARLYEHN